MGETGFRFGWLGYAALYRAKAFAIIEFRDQLFDGERTAIEVCDVT